MLTRKISNVHLTRLLYVHLLAGMIVAVGISNLKDVDMNSSRNLFVFGFSFFLGLTVSEWLNGNPGVIKTGSKQLIDFVKICSTIVLFKAAT
jgi:nucleobase transporter 1/2